MIIDSKKYNGLCSCGRTHEMGTKEVLIEAGALKRLDEYTSKYGLTGKRVVIYDSNTYHAVNMIHPSAAQEIILLAENLHANEFAVEMVQSQLIEDVSYLVAVGGGTIHDTTRYCANAKGIPFVACPTAATVDGFCSTISAMTWKGFKTTMPGIAPILVLADIDIIKEAPYRLTLSGVGDILGKYTALADWKTSHVLTGEYFCPVIEKMTRDAVEAVYACCTALENKSIEAFEQLTYGLLLSGLAMQMMENSRPASGCEHHISHLIEMKPDAFFFQSDGLHGEKVGVGTILVSKVVHEWLKIEDITKHVKPYAFPAAEDVEAFYGEALYPSMVKENADDCMNGVTTEKLISVWSQICEIIKTIPTEEELHKLYQTIGAKCTLEELDVPSEYLEKLLYYSPTARNRLTMMRMRWMLC